MIFGKRKREVEALVVGYNEGYRLMRNGDGADEFIGMKTAREYLLRLVALGRTETGHRANPETLKEVLLKHGLREEARAMFP